MKVKVVTESSGGNLEWAEVACDMVNTERRDDQPDFVSCYRRGKLVAMFPKFSRGIACSRLVSCHAVD